jgi:hypothetical protein
MRIVTSILFVLVTGAASSQYRIALDVNSALDNMFTSVLFCPVLKNSFYLKAGISKGNYGNGEIRVEGDGQAATSPYSEVNEHDENPDIQLTLYQSKNKGIGVELGIGKCWSFGKIHAIRFDLQWKGYRIHERVTAFYVGQITDTSAFRNRYEFKRNCMSFGPEIFHSIQISRRFNVYYGVKFPFFIPVPAKNYHSPTNKELTIGLQPNLALGLSYAFEKRNRKKKASFTD